MLILEFNAIGLKDKIDLKGCVAVNKITIKESEMQILYAILPPEIFSFFAFHTSIATLQISSCLYGRTINNLET